MPLRLVESKAGHREIADDDGLSLPTVKKHVHLIFRKLEVASRSQLIALMRSGSCTIYSVCVLRL
jgi:DNA-binding CsgD family transcriptional regulator